MELGQTGKIRAAIRRATAYAEENHVPLTAERLAAELQMDGETFRRYVDPSYRPEDPAFEPALQAIRIANTQAVASVLEHALTKGSGVNMHMLYLKQYADYHDRTRAFAMSIHQTAYYVGIILSGYAAGVVGELWGWRNAFYIFGAIGVLHGIIMAGHLRDRKHPATEPTERGGGNEQKPRFAEGFRIVFTTPTALILTLSFSGLIFVLTGYLTWMPTYLYERFDMALAAAGFHSMFYTHLFAFVGILIAGRISDRIAAKHPASRMAMQGIGLLAAVPFIVMMGHSSTLWIIYLGFAGFGFARAFFDANTYTVLYDVVPERYHSSASGVMIMTGFAIGALAPVILGAVKEAAGLSSGITMLAGVWLVCGVLMLAGSKRFYMKNYNRINNV